MASGKQRAAARRNVKKAQSAAQRRQTLKHLSSEVRTALAVEANRVRAGEAETRKELDAEARRLGIVGRSKLGKDELRQVLVREREREH